MEAVEMSAFDRLNAIEEIKILKARYFRSLDTKDWASMEQTMTPDVICDYRGAATDPATGINAVPGATEKPLAGRMEAIEMLRRGLDGVVTAHQGYMPEIEILNTTHARGIWAMYDALRFPFGGDLAELHGFGHYHETYECHAGRWLIASLRLTRLRVDIVSR